MRKLGTVKGKGENRKWEGYVGGVELTDLFRVCLLFVCFHLRQSLAIQPRPAWN